MLDGERTLAAIVRALATLGLAGASIALGLQLALLPVDRLQAFLALNFVPPTGGRWELLAWAAAGAVLACAPAVELWIRCGWAAEPAVSRMAALASPLIVVAVLPQLRAVHFWADRPLQALVLVALFAVALERLLAHALRAVPPSWSEGSGRVLGRLSPHAREGLARVAVVGFALIYAALAARFTILRHWRFESGGFDLGIHENLMWNAMHGDFFRSAIVFPEWTTFLAHHAHLASFLFLPLYALRPGAETMLVFQALYVGLAAIPLYLFARVLLPRGAALLISIAYLLYAPVHGVNSYDFHWLPLSISLFFALFWALATLRTGVAIAFVVLLLLVREDVSLGVATLGAFLALTGIRVRFGLVLVAVALVWFATLKLGLMHAAGGAQYSELYGELIAPGEEGFGSVVRTAIVNPAFLIGELLDENKLVYFLHFLAPLVFVPLRRPAFLLLLLPGFVVTLMTTKYSPTVSISFQYVAHWIPWVFGACVLCLHLARDEHARRATVLALFIAVLAHGYPFGGALQHETFVAGFGRSRFDMSAEDWARRERFLEVAAHVPPEASVAATENEVPHLSTRRVIYTLKWGFRDADYVLVNRDHLGGPAAPRVLQRLMAGYRKVAEEGEFSLFERTN